MSVNWTKLVADGRAKDLGVAWDEDELNSLVAITQAKSLRFSDIAPFVREHGAITVEEYEEHFEARKEEETRGYLEKVALEKGVKFSGETPITTLRSLIDKASDKTTAKEPANQAATKTTKKGAKKDK